MNRARVKIISVVFILYQLLDGGWGSVYIQNKRANFMQAVYILVVVCLASGWGWLSIAAP